MDETHGRGPCLLRVGLRHRPTAPVDLSDYESLPGFSFKHLFRVIGRIPTHDRPPTSRSSPHRFDRPKYGAIFQAKQEGLRKDTATRLLGPLHRLTQSARSSRIQPSSFHSSVAEYAICQ